MSIRDGYQSDRDPHSFDRFNEKYGRLVFSATSEVRRRVDHAGEFTCLSLEPDTCHKCLERHNDVMLSLYETIRDRLDNESFAIVPYLRAAARGRAQGLEEERAAEQGMMAKPERFIASTVWVAKALPLPGQLEILRLMMYYVRSADRPEPGSDYPVNRFADHLGLDPNWVAEQVIEIPRLIAAVSERRAVWVAANLTEPLERKQERDDPEPLDDLPVWQEPASSPDDRPVEDIVVTFLAPTDLSEVLAETEKNDEQMAARLELIDQIVGAGRRHLSTQKVRDHAAALRLGAREVLPADQAAALEASPEFVQLARDIFAS